jgi:hypothetical protein
MPHGAEGHGAKSRLNALAFLARERGPPPQGTETMIETMPKNGAQDGAGRLRSE